MIINSDHRRAVEQSVAGGHTLSPMAFLVSIAGEGYVSDFPISSSIVMPDCDVRSKEVLVMAVANGMRRLVNRILFQSEVWV